MDNKTLFSELKKLDEIEKKKNQELKERMDALWEQGEEDWED